ncbi:hypothetical protein A1O1_07739 [Capronia coronata CBS 617.96]|uniref:Transcription factor domain-containing protein n=1 Tax=Capronia coronata CBS 617.96 TaxID=1182541 RepID=W9YHB8_9EURO|nr:uncharacterized protein A1O1_07739 [Capronia coronata CBS 617.96]EXJ81674.1 hypothetical protein A1O1_07739 [Capronia coronata CBS 617.96]
MSKDKPSPNQPAPFRGEFSFVNKDAGNIDSKDHSAAVSWHVMNRYERWKKQEQARRLRASANVPVGPLSAPPVQQQNTLPQRSQQQSVRRVPYEIPRRTSFGDAAQSTAAASMITPFGFDPWLTEQPLQLGYPGVSVGQASGSGNATSSNSTSSTRSAVFEDDPTSLLSSINTPLDFTDESFGPSASSMAPLMDSLLSFAYDVFIPQNWPKESDRAQGSYEIARCWDDIANMSQDNCYANAYLSLLTAALAAVSDNYSLAYQSRFFQGQAMTELRQRVAGPGPQDLNTLQAILKLFSSETIVDNTSVARAHLKMLRKLVTAAGGIILTHAWFREDLLSCDCYFALKYETRPLFPAQEWTPGGLSEPWKARLLSAGIVGDHAAGIDSLIEQPVMKAVVTDLRELFKVDEYIQSHDVPMEDQLLRWRQLRKFDCISRIADQSVNLSIYPHLFQRPHAQAYVCLATALMANMVLGSPEPVRFGLKLIGQLRKKLEESDAQGDNGHYTRLRLWALYVGSLAGKVHPVDTEDKVWFEARYQHQAAEMGVAGWQDVRKVVRHFLYSEKLHQEIASGRAHRTSDLFKGLYSPTGCSWREPVSDANVDLMPVELASGGESGELGSFSSDAAGRHKAFVGEGSGGGNQ